MKAAFFRSALLAAIALAASPAAAESAPLGSAIAQPYSRVAKSEAIIGGPSRLAAILAAQSGAPAPASRGLPELRPAVVRLDPVSPDRPDVFGSVALPIERSPLDERWRKVAFGTVGGAAIRYAASLETNSPLERIDAVNRYVNARVTFTNDSDQFGTADRWMSGGDTLRLGKGDCEDYAIAKMQMLRQAGFAERDLYLVILRDTRRNADHAVLVVRAEGRLLVLDNGTDRIFDSAVLSDYRPIMTFAGKRVWTHGYRRALPPVQMASNNAPQPVTIAAPAPSSGTLRD